MKFIKSIAFVFMTIGFASVASAQPAGSDKIIDKIKSSKELRVCQAAYPPYNSKDPKTGDWEGMNVEMVSHIADLLGVKLVNVDSSFSTLISSLNTDKCDLSAAATYVSPPRAEQVLFTDSFASDTKTIFVPESSEINSYEEIDKPDKVIVSRAGTSELEFAKKFFKEAQVKAITSTATQAHLLEVASGRADAAFAGTTGGLLFLNENENVKLRKIDDEPLSPSLFAFMLPSGEYHFQNYLNVVIQSLEGDGTLAELREKWFPFDIGDSVSSR